MICGKEKASAARGLRCVGEAAADNAGQLESLNDAAQGQVSEESDPQGVVAQGGGQEGVDGEKSRGRGGHADEHARSGGGAHKKPVEQKACHADRWNGDGIGKKGFGSSAHRNVVGEECDERRSAQGVGQSKKKGEPRAPKEEGADQAVEAPHAARPDEVTAHRFAGVGKAIHDVAHEGEELEQDGIGRK